MLDVSGNNVTLPPSLDGESRAWYAGVFTAQSITTIYVSQDLCPRAEFSMRCSPMQVYAGWSTTAVLPCRFTLADCPGFVLLADPRHNARVGEGVGERVQEG